MFKCVSLRPPQSQRSRH